mgnify:CR=1 FL=1
MCKVILEAYRGAMLEEIRQTLALEFFAPISVCCLARNDLRSGL